MDSNEHIIPLPVPAHRVSPYGPKRLLWLCVGLLSFGVGAVGAFVPLLPTTSLMLVAAFAFAKSSPRLHSWLLRHKIFGPLIVNWHGHRAISFHAKVASLLSMALVVGVSLALRAPIWVIAIQVSVLVCVSVFLWTRPAPPKPE